MTDTSECTHAEIINSLKPRQDCVTNIHYNDYRNNIDQYHFTKTSILAVASLKLH